MFWFWFEYALKKFSAQWSEMSNDVKSIVRFLKAYGNFSAKQREVGWPCWPWPRPPGSRSSASSCSCRARRTWTGAGRCRRSSARTWRSSRPPTWRSPASRPWPAKQSRFVLRTTSVMGNIAGCMIRCNYFFYIAAYKSCTSSIKLKSFKQKNTNIIRTN